MPWDSEYARSHYGDKAAWTQSEHLLATLIDAIQAGNYQFARVHSKRGHPPEKPKPFPRPGDRSRRRVYRTQLSTNEIARRLVEQQRADEQRRREVT